MAKRLILAMVSMLVVLVIFLIYRQATEGLDAGSSTETVAVPVAMETGEKDGNEVQLWDAGPIGVAQAEGLHLQRRDEHGNLEREYAFDKRLSGGENTSKVAGPLARIYSSNQQVFEITSDTGTVTFGPGAGQLQWPDYGSLEGHVRIKMYQLGNPLEAAQTPAPPKRVKLLVELDRLEFEREFSRLVGSGHLTIQSEQFSAIGHDLELQYDQLNDRLQELTLRHVEELRMVTSAIAPPSATPGSSKAKGPKAESKTKQADHNKKPGQAMYRLTLQDDVVIDSGSEQLRQVDLVEVLVDIDSSRMGTIADVSAPAAAAPDGTTEETMDSAGTTAPQATAIVTCKGPLRITAVEQASPQPRAGSMIFSAFGKGMQLWRNEALAVAADVLRYDHGLQTIEFIAGENRPVTLALTEHQQATVANKVRYDRTTGLATMKGPGHIQYATPGRDQGGTVIFQGQLDAKFTVSSPGGASLASIAQGPLQRLAFSGQLEVVDPEGQIRAESGVLLFDEPSPDAPDRVTSQTTEMGRIRTIELSGDVKAVAANRNFEAQHVVAHFAPDSAGTPQLVEAVARGNVQFEDADYHIEASDEVKLVFDETSQSSQGDSSDQDQAAFSASESLGFSQFLRQGSLKYAHAQGPDGAVRLTDRKHNYQLIGDSAEGNGLDNTWQIRGNPVRLTGLGPAAQLQQLEAPLIIADLDAGACRIPGAGSMDLISQSPLTAQPEDQPVRIHLGWQQGATYTIGSGQVVFYDAKAEMETTDQSRQSTVITCPVMTVQLDNASAAIAEQKADRLSDKSFTKLIAHGPQVSLHGRQLDRQTNAVLRDLQMQAQQITFDVAGRLLTVEGEGWIELVEHESAAKQGTAGNTRSLGNALSGMLGPDGASYTLVRFRKQMSYDTDLGELHFVGGLAVDRLALPDAGEGKLDAQRLASLPGYRLGCQNLTMGIPAGKERVAAESPERQDSAGDVESLRYLRAWGDVVLEMFGPPGRHHIFMSSSLDYDHHKQLLVLRGSEQLPVWCDQIQCLSVRYDLRRETIEVIPLGQSLIANQF